MSSSFLWNAAAVVAAACISGAAFSMAEAQTTGTTGTSGTTGVSARGAGDGLEVGLSGSASEQMSAAETMLARATTLSQRVTQMLDDARRDADVIRVTCLNDKLTQINANLRTAQSRHATLLRTVDIDQRRHELTVLSVLGQKLQVLDQESNQCVGQDLYETGPTKITTEIDTSLLPFENNPTTPTITTPTAPTNLGVTFSSAMGISAPG
ncbi:MAG TPA: hypothetical protein VFN67_28160 [Polyangiales bacterium]|nr:hypothetical protein [Polyangiales bacterium]